MTVIALESEIIASRYDANTRLCHYTIQRGHHRWTATVHQDELEKHKGPTHRQLRRNHVANALMQKMTGPPDPHAGAKDDPHRPADWADFEAIQKGDWYVNAADGQVQQKA